MQKTKLIMLLKTFSKQEMKDFEKFFISPYFSSQRNLKPLFNELKKFHPSFESPHLTIEKIFRKLNPGKKYEKKKSDHYLQVMFSDLATLAEKFIILELLFNEDNIYRVYGILNTAFKNRNMANYRNKIILKEMELIKKIIGGYQFYYEMSVLNNDLAETSWGLNKITDAFDYIQRIPLYLYGYNLSCLSVLVNNYTAIPRFYSYKPKSLALLEMGIQSFDPWVFEKECYDDGLGTKQLVLTNYYVLKAQLNKDDYDSVVKAIEIYKSNFHMLNYTSKWDFFNSLYNICALRRFEADYKKYLFLRNDLIDFVISKGILDTSEEEHVEPKNYFLFLHFKIFTSDKEELKKFIDLMLEKVHNEVKIWLFDYSYAWISFMDNDYERTLEYLSKFNSKNLSYKNYAAQLRILSLYSLGYFEEALYRLNSHEQYIYSNTKISGEKNYTDLLFIKSVRTLINYRTNSDMSDDYILDKIRNDNKYNNFHSWFRAEAEKLKKAGVKHLPS